MCWLIMLVCFRRGRAGRICMLQLYYLYMDVVKRLIIRRTCLNDAFNVNVTSVHQVTNAFLPLLRQGQKKTVANMYSPPYIPTLHIKHRLRNRSTSLGSISLSQQSHSMPGPAYKITKAALNMLTAQYAHTYAKEGFVIFALSPGVRPFPYGPIRNG